MIAFPRGHRRQVLVRSAPGAGSRFDLMLPAMTAAGDRPAGITVPAMAAAGGPLASVAGNAQAGGPRGNWTRQ
jgi:hypothetical protein